MTARRPPVALATKFTVPALRSAHVERPRLLKRLDQDHAGRLVVVTGPPGSGKTVLVCQWVASRVSSPVAWVSLDESDNAPDRLWRHIETALTRAGLPPAAPSVHATTTGSIRAIRSLLDRLHAAGGGFVLVLDNLHTIPDRKAAEGLAYFVQHQPAGCQTVVASRADPPFGLADLRADGAVIEVRERDLRFLREEIDDLVGLADVALSDDDIHCLEEKTEGWAAGLQLALLSVRDQDDPHLFVERFAGTTNVVADFLVGEVLDRLDDDERNFLLATSIVDHPTAALCDALLDRTDSAAVLRRLEASNTLIVGLDETSEAYRYHHLFRDLLRAELHRRDPALERSLHRKAARWFEQSGDVSAAIDHALACGEGDLAVELIGSSDLYYDTATAAAVRGWLAKIPRSAVSESVESMLTVAQASMAAGLIEDAGEWLRIAEQHLAASGEGERMAPEILAHVAWWHSWRGQPDVAIGAADRAASASVKGESMPFQMLDRLRVRAYTRLEQYAEAREAYRRLPPAGSVEEAVADVSLLSRTAYGEGNLREAAGLATQAFEQAAARELGDRPILLDARLTLGALSLERNELDDAEELLTGTATMARQSGWIGTEFLAELELARLEAARGNLREAIEKLSSLGRSATENDLSRAFVHQTERIETEVWLRLGDHRRAEALAADLPYKPESRVLMARCQLAKGRADGARLLLADGAGWSVRTRLARSAVLACCADDPDEAAAHMGEALSVAVREGYFRTLLDEGAAAVELMSGLDLAGPSARLVEELVTSHRAETDRQHGADELSDREAVVLQCLPTHLSNQEIAAQLYVSLNTLKTHLRNIYRKLGVSSRREAIERAAALGLLPEPYVRRSDSRT